MYNNIGKILRDKVLNYPLTNLTCERAYFIPYPIWSNDLSYFIVKIPSGEKGVCGGRKEFTDVWKITSDGSSTTKLTTLPTSFDQVIVSPMNLKIIFSQKKTLNIAGWNGDIEKTYNFDQEITSQTLFRSSYFFISTGTYDQQISYIGDISSNNSIQPIEINGKPAYTTSVIQINDSQFLFTALVDKHWGIYIMSWQSKPTLIYSFPEEGSLYRVNAKPLQISVLK